MNQLKGRISDSVLLPGDPRRATYIAQNYLKDSEEFNDSNRLFGYTGIYEGAVVSVMGSGMGIPSVLFASNILYEQYNVKNIIRIGTCGTAQQNVNIGDMLIALGCSTTSGINRHVFSGSLFCPVADFELLNIAVETARKENIEVKVGNLLSTDLFYDIVPNNDGEIWWDFGILGVEMEGAGLYTSAMRYMKRALMICTVSDSIVTRQGMTPEQRETSLHDMITLGLKTIVSFNKTQNV